MRIQLSFKLYNARVARGNESAGGDLLHVENVVHFEAGQVSCLRFCQFLLRKIECQQLLFCGKHQMSLIQVIQLEILAAAQSKHDFERLCRVPTKLFSLLVSQCSVVIVAVAS